MIKILIADDHAVVREGLKQILSESSHLVVADEASDGYEVMDKLNKHAYDLIILDIALPGKSGLEILKDIKSQKAKLPVLVLSMYPEEQYAVRVLKAGASGYLTKESAPNELVNAIKQIAQGRKYISPTLAEKLVGELELDTEKPLHETLSDREYEVMIMIASGKRIKEIAYDLTLSEKTVSTYRIRILEKMGMKSNADLTRYAISNKLMD
jgi:two-component system, NarL family, invasion response regulator UvrY